MSNKKTKFVSGVLGLAVNQNKEFLLTLRNEPRHKNSHKHWQIPGGGMEFGESPEETLVRELKEEINVIPSVIFPFPIVKHQIWYKKYFAVQVNLMCFLVDVGQQQIEPDGYETLDYQWASYHKLSNLKSLPLTTVFVAEAQKILIEHSDCYATIGQPVREHAR